MRIKDAGIPRAAAMICARENPQPGRRRLDQNSSDGANEPVVRTLLIVACLLLYGGDDETGF
jgi:hypothetical protein